MRNEPMSEAEEDAQIWCYTRRGDTLFPVADLETTGWDRTSQGKGGGDGLVGKCTVYVDAETIRCRTRSERYAQRNAAGRWNEDDEIGFWMRWVWLSHASKPKLGGSLFFFPLGAGTRPRPPTAIVAVSYEKRCLVRRLREIKSRNQQKRREQTTKGYI
jgi:hypothetical protein